MQLSKTQVTPGTLTQSSSSGSLSPVLKTGVVSGEISGGTVEVRSLEPGQTFSGQITDIRNGQVTVSVSGQMLHAKFDSSVSLCMGEVVNFVVRENNGDKILIAPFTRDSLSFLDAALYKALDASGLPATDRNIDIISGLLKNQMAVDKESIRQMLSLSLKFPETDIENILILKKNEIPVNEENLSQLMNYRTGEHKLAEDINRFMELLPDTLNDMVRKEGLDKTLSFLRDLELLPDKKEPGQPRLEDSAPDEALLRLSSVKNPEELLKLFDREDFKSSLQNELLTRWSLKPEELDAEGLNRVYDKLKQNMEHVREKLDTLQTANEAGETPERTVKNAMPAADLSHTAKTLESNIKFLRDINQQYIMAELPLLFREKATHGDLYVFAGKKRRTGSEDGIKVLLHLDMEHLGGTDIFIYLSGHSLRLTFTMEDKEGLSLLKGRFPGLEGRLSEKGYSVLSEFREKEKDFDFVDDFLEQDQVKTRITRYSFDMRA